MTAEKKAPVQKTTEQLLADAEEQQPVSHTGGHREIKVVNPVKVQPSLTGGFQMTQKEKAAAEADARRTVFPN